MRRVLFLAAWLLLAAAARAQTGGEPLRVYGFPPLTALTGVLLPSHGGTGIANSNTNTLTLGSPLTLSTGQYPGTTTNDSANAGNIGEYVYIASAAGTGTATFTATSPTVVTVATWSSGAQPNSTSFCLPDQTRCIQPVCFTSSVALPTGISACGTQQYYIDPNSWSGTTFKIATTPANAFSGTDVGASDTGTGVHTATNLVQATSGAAIAISSAVLTAGDWQCMGVSNPIPNGATTTSASTLLTSGSAASVASLLQNAGVQSTATLAAGLATGQTTGWNRRSVAGTNLSYLNTSMTFATNIMQVQGTQNCRRMR